MLSSVFNNYYNIYNNKKAFYIFVPIRDSAWLLLLFASKFVCQAFRSIFIYKSHLK